MRPPGFQDEMVLLALSESLLENLSVFMTNALDERTGFGWVTLKRNAEPMVMVPAVSSSRRSYIPLGVGLKVISISRLEIKLKVSWRLPTSKERIRCKSSPNNWTLVVAFASTSNAFRLLNLGILIDLTVGWSGVD